MFPDRDLVIACTSNIAMVTQMNDNLPNIIAETVLDLPKTVGDWIEDVAVPAVKELYKNIALTAQGFLPPKVPNKPASFANNLKAYVGEYSDPLWGSFEIGITKEKDSATGKEKEVLTFKYNDFNSTLEHYHYDAFVATFNDVLFMFRALITFSPDPVPGKHSKSSGGLPIKRLQIQELPAGDGISKSVFEKK